MVFYRTYRPQTIAELDKEDVRMQLTSIFSRGTIPHAFLFTGPKGTGKTSTARIVAKILNCERVGKKGTVEPCNVCANCRAITNGSYIDVLEIDAASNRGIDEIRELRDKIAFSPAMGKKKVYIIDEVHMLTKEAFNALLKTLEEPPSHAVFILATTERHKVPDTIVSRSTEIRFTKATPEELARSLGRIVTGERVKITPKILITVASQSDGSFRDAAKLLEQTIAGVELSNFAQGARQFLEHLVKHHTKGAFICLENLEKTGADFQDFTKQVLDVLHTELVARYISEKKELAFSSYELRQLIALFSRAYTDIKSSYIEQLPLELAVIEWNEKKLQATG